MSTRSVNVGICGLGTVASGLVNIINRQSALLRDRADADLRLVHIARVATTRFVISHRIG